MRERFVPHEGITSIPPVPLDDVGIGLVPYGLHSFVISYVGWTTQEIDGFETPQSDRETLNFFLSHGTRELKNTPQQTRELLRWMEENPFRVAEFLEQVWPNVADAKSYTDPFRLKAIRGKIPSLGSIEL